MEKIKRLDYVNENQVAASHHFNETYLSLALRIYEKGWLPYPKLPVFSLEHCKLVCLTGPHYIEKMVERVIAADIAKIRETSPYSVTESQKAPSATEIQNDVGDIKPSYRTILARIFESPWKPYAGFELLSWDPVTGKPSYTEENRNYVRELCKPEDTPEFRKYLELGRDMEAVYLRADKYTRELGIPLEIVKSSRVWQGKPLTSLLLMHNDKIELNPVFFTSTKHR